MIFRQLFYILGAAIMLSACGGGSASSSRETSLSSPGDTIPMEYARNIVMIEREGLTQVDIRNPWDTTRVLHRYVLIERGKDLPGDVKDATVLTVPLQRPVVYSGVHASLLGELGHGDAVKGVCDTDYIFDPELLRRIKNGEIADCGVNTNPDLEKIFSLSPDAVLLSPYENSRDYSKLERAGVAVVECADYMESSPLGRAEWMKFYGRLFDEADKADSIFSSTAKEYLDLKSKASKAGARPKVLFDRIYSGIWYVPERNSTTGRFIEDAGGLNPFAENDKAGSAPLTPEKVLAKAGDADFWLIRHAGEKISKETLGKENPMYPQFRPYKEGTVYVTDTSRSRVFEDAAFHPQWLLSDMISLLHPELGVTPLRSYYSRLPQ